VIGWISAYQFVLGLELAGPEFSKQKVIDALNTQTDVAANGMMPSIDWTTGHINPAKHPEVRAKVSCQNFIVIRAGKFVPTFATAGKPYVCLDQSTNTVPENPPARSFVDG